MRIPSTRPTGSVAFTVGYIMLALLLFPFSDSFGQEKVPSAKMVERARYSETRLIYALLAGGENEGVIGGEARKSLQRLPSNIYWLGLGSWGSGSFRDHRTNIIAISTLTTSKVGKHTERKRMMN